MYVSSKVFRSGSAIAAILKHSWRESDGQEISFQEIETALPSLRTTGSAALIWRRVSRLHAESVADLREVYHQQAISAMIQEHSLADIFQRMRQQRVEPILLKGWSLARLYPDAAMRPSGDIDLWVASGQLAQAYRAIPTQGRQAYCVDLHTKFYPQYERSFAEVMNQSQCCSLNGIDVRVPCPEDHLRFICLHFLFHGGWRPLWLCDVALMVESAGSEFDWDRCLRGNRKYADWIACVIGLAHQLLGADVSNTPVKKRATSLPRWLIPAVLEQWEKGPGMSFTENLSFSVTRRLLEPKALRIAFREHWRNPIQASVEMNAWFNESPRGFFQFSSVFLRVPEFVKYFGREIRRT
jgi:hypothetical protein